MADSKDDLYLANNVYTLEKALGNRLPRKKGRFSRISWKNTEKAKDLARQLVKKVKRQTYYSKNKNEANRQRREAVEELARAISNGRLTPNTILDAPLPSPEEIDAIRRKRRRTRKDAGRKRQPPSSSLAKKMLPMALLMTSPAAAAAAGVARQPSTALVPFSPPVTPAAMKFPILSTKNIAPTVHQPMESKTKVKYTYMNGRTGRTQTNVMNAATARRILKDGTRYKNHIIWRDPNVRASVEKQVATGLVPLPPRPMTPTPPTSSGIRWNLWAGRVPNLMRPNGFVQRILALSRDAPATKEFVERLAESGLSLDQVRTFGTIIANVMETVVPAERAAFLREITKKSPAEWIGALAVERLTTARNRGLAPLLKWLPESVAEALLRYVRGARNGGNQFLALVGEVTKDMNPTERVEFVTNLTRQAYGKSLSLLRGISILGQGNWAALSRIVPDRALVAGYAEYLGQLEFPQVKEFAGASFQILKSMPTLAFRMEFLKGVLGLGLRFATLKVAMGALKKLAKTIWNKPAPPAAPAGKRNEVVAPQNNNAKNNKKLGNITNSSNISPNNNNNNNNTVRPAFNRNRRDKNNNTNMDVPLQVAAGLLGATVMSGALLLAGGGFGQ